jgi:thymidylate kinase
MPFIAFLGCDGSGKSAVIQGIAERLSAEGHQITLGHWRPKPFASSGTTSLSSADDPHGQKPRGVASTILKLAWLWLNWWVAWFQYLRSQSRKGYVLFDRYHGDLLVDPHRYRYGGPMCLARIVTRWMPQPDRVIFLDASPDVLLSRKQEVSREALEIARTSYLHLSSRTHSKIELVDASSPLDEVIDDALKLISDSNS